MGNQTHELVKISQGIGKNIAYVQGGGGNTSVKIDETRLAIKASGYLLKDVSETDGYCIVDYQAICSYLETPDMDEDLFTQKIKSFVIETNVRPSIETGFHALLGDVVIHSHSVYTNLLTCSKEGETIVSEFFPEALWVDYVNPGRDLTLAIKESLKQKPNASTIFLQNHGLIVSSDVSDEALYMHEHINKHIKDYLNVNDFQFNEDIPFDVDFIKNHVLFPDQVVYALAGEVLLKTQAGQETFAAYNFIDHTLKEKKLTPHFISQENVDILINMESEKYRQKVVKK